jgi:hypothetical protein
MYNTVRLVRFLKISEFSHFMKIHQVGAELFNADRRTDGYT